ncbi:hypothetical protein BH11ARM1_BH11ARM1_16840 [soil metagenome]
MSVFLLASSLAFCAPKVLIVQMGHEYKKNADNPNRPIANYLAGQIDQDGRLESVVYSMSDPFLRDAVNNGKFGPVLDQPSVKDAKAAASQLGTEYLITVEAYAENGKYQAKLELFRGGRSIWKDAQNAAVTSGPALRGDDSLLSLASTLTARMGQDPLKSLSARPVIPTPPPDQGQNPIPVVVEAPISAKKDYTELLKTTALLIANGKANLAVPQLRDAVDVDPLEPTLRIALINALMVLNPEVAANEARTAANLIPESLELRTMAARAWLAVGKPDEAQKDLNEAIARNPDAPETRLLLSEVALTQLKPEVAIEHTDMVLKAGPAPQALFLHALAECLLGASTASTADLDAYAKADQSALGATDQIRYDLATSVFARQFQKSAIELRNQMQKAAIKPDDKSVLEAVNSQMRMLRCLSDFAGRMTCPAKFAPLNQQRVLGLSLLAQAASGILSFMGGGGEETLAGARIDLGEAIRNETEFLAAQQAARK